MIKKNKENNEKDNENSFLLQHLRQWQDMVFMLTNNRKLCLNLMLANVEALADCEITKGGSVKLKCTGDGSCSKSYLGYTLTCDGTKVD